MWSPGTAAIDCKSSCQGKSTLPSALWDSVSEFSIKRLSRSGLMSDGQAARKMLHRHTGCDEPVCPSRMVRASISSGSALSCAVGAGDHQGHRLSVAIRETAALDAPFAATGRIRADFFPARRRSVHAVNPSLPAPVNLLESFTREKPCEPEALEDACLSSIVKPPYGLTGANTIRLHLAWTSCRHVSG